MRRSSIFSALVAGALLVPAQASAVSPDIVISEVYGGGGNSGAPYQNDFVELFNRGASTISLDGRSVQYASATGTGTFTVVAALSGDLAPGQRALVRAAGGTNGQPLPAPDFTGGTAMSASAGKVALVDQASALPCNGGSSPCSDEQRAVIRDLVGYGTANFYEGAGPAPGTSNSTSVQRNAGGCNDTDNNAADFAAGAPTPQNRADAATPCGAPPPTDTPPAVEGSDPGNGDRDVPRDADITVTFTEPVAADAGAFSLTCGGSEIGLAVAAQDDTTYVLDPQQTLPAGTSCTLRVEGDGYRDADTDDPPDTGSDYAATFTTRGIEGLRIHDIQGRQHLSPYRDALVAGVPGVVTATRFNGFYVQDPQPDADPRTSEGIFVFTGSGRQLPPVGTALAVSGRVEEFRSGCTPSCTAPDFPAGNFGSSAFANLTITEIASPSWTATGGGTIAATVVGEGGRVPPRTVIDDDTPDPQTDDPPLATGNVEDKSSAPGDTANQDPTFDPDQDGIDFYESLEGMLTRVNRAVVVEPTNTFNVGRANENSEVAVLADDGAGASVRAPRGPIVVRAFDRTLPQEYRLGDFNPERIILNDPVARDNDLTPLPADAEVGDRFEGSIDAVVDYSFGNFKFLVRDSAPLAKGALEPERAARGSRGELSVATYNVENLDPVNDAERIGAIARQIRDNLRAPDILGLQEVQDNDGETPSGNANGDATWQAIVDALQAEGLTYDYRQIDPVYNQDGGAPGANIRVGFLFRPDRVQFVDRPGGTAVTATEDDPAQPGAQLTFSPGRIDPNNPVWESSRKPLAGEFRFRGRTVFVVANHFASKGGDAPLFGRFQEPYRPSELQRRGATRPAQDPQRGQAGVVNAWVERLLAADRRARVVVLGDLNDFDFSETTRVLERGAPEGWPELIDLWRFVPENRRYSYIFQGNAQVLDHILASPALLGTLRGYDAVHVNVEFGEGRAQSDHDPAIARFALGGDDEEDEDDDDEDDDD